MLDESAKNTEMIKTVLPVVNLLKENIIFNIKRYRSNGILKDNARV